MGIRVLGLPTNAITPPLGPPIVLNIIVPCTPTIPTREVSPLFQEWLQTHAPGRAARVMGLTDRDDLAPGKRADLVVVNPETQAVEATICAGRLAFAQGGAAARLMGSALMAAQ